jgi:hypothetical protein
MKKILFFLSMLFSTTVFAQPCNTCPVQGQTAPAAIDPMAFNPGIFTPVTVGTYSTGNAYIKEAPALTLMPIMMTAYVQMLDASGRLWEIPISGELKAPADWNGTFWTNRANNEPMKYPKVVPMTIDMTGVFTTNGRVILDQSGQPVPIRKVHFY